MRDPAAPDLGDQPLPDVAADREVHVQPVPARMPLRRPRVRQRRAAQLAPQPSEELRYVRPQLAVVEAAAAGVGQRRKAIEPVRGAVAAKLPPGPPRGLL